MVFPATILDLRAELLLGSLGWTDISTYALQRDPVTATRGSLPSSQGSLPPPSACSLTFQNDGRFSPRNPAGPWYGLIGRNTQLRLSVPDGELVTNGDFDAYWRFHLSREQERVHLARYAPDVLPMAA